MCHFLVRWIQLEVYGTYQTNAIRFPFILCWNQKSGWHVGMFFSTLQSFWPYAFILFFPNYKTHLTMSHNMCSPLRCAFRDKTWKKNFFVPKLWNHRFLETIHLLSCFSCRNVFSRTPYSQIPALFYFSESLVISNNAGMH